VHATIAGVTLGLVVPARARAADGGMVPEHGSKAERVEHAVRPWSDTLALPVFAFFAAGVSLASTGGFAAVVGSPEAWGVAVGLVVGKPLGVMAAVLLLGRFTRLQLPAGMRAVDAVPVAFLTGIGFTVSLLVSELAFGEGATHDEATLAVFVGSLLSAALAAAVLAARRRTSHGTVPPGDSAARPL
jgi:NhaA family Na+:H+ antiporter